MKKEKMYSERKANIAAFRGCDFRCRYCAFQNTLKRSNCQQCRDYKPHAHLEVLKRRPPRTNNGEFITMGLNGDISFASFYEMEQMIKYCNVWSDRTFVMQSKNPRAFLPFRDFITDNIIIGTTIESNINYNISKAPSPEERYDALRQLDCRKLLTIEPIMSFTFPFEDWIKNLSPEIVYIGYDSKNNKLQEPRLETTLKLISNLRELKIDVREKMLRKSWTEGASDQ